VSSVAVTASRNVVAADLLKLRKRRGLVVVCLILTVGATVLTYGIIELVHAANPATHGPAGGVANLGHGAWLIAALGSVAAAVVGSIAAVGDLEAGVYRDLVVTGRSRLVLFGSRIPGGLAFLLPLVGAGYTVAAVATVVFADGRPAPGTRLLVTTGLWTLVEVTFYYLLALGIACLIGSRSYTIGIVLGWRLALTPILASISALGIVREFVPGVALQDLAPAALGDSVRQGSNVPMSTAAIAAVLVVWAVIAVALGGWRDVRRDA
jgi:ABC-type transport system involved in multi-copper enzyme maturation permease subunit